MLDRNKTRWTSYDDRAILVKDLEVRHLVNILNHIKESNERLGRPAYGEDITNLLIAEAKLRIVAGWAENKAIPKQREDGTWEVINQTAKEKARGDVLTAAHQMQMQKHLKEKKDIRKKKMELLHNWFQRN